MVPIVDTLTGIAMATVIVVGGPWCSRKSLDIGVMVAFLFYIQRFFDPIRSLTLQYSVMQRAMASGQRISEVLDVPVEVTDKPEAHRRFPDDMRRLGRVPRDVTFGYRPEPAGAQERVVPRQSGRDGRAGRSDRLRQDERHGAGPPLLRRLAVARCWSAATTSAT